MMLVYIQKFFTKILKKEVMKIVTMKKNSKRKMSTSGGTELKFRNN